MCTVSFGRVMFVTATSSSRETITCARPKGRAKKEVCLSGLFPIFGFRSSSITRDCDREKGYG